MNSNPKKFIGFISDIRNQRWIVAGLTLIISLVFLLICNLQKAPGFPLDDAWIHQTYARNLAQSGHWEYIPGQSSAGSTSPLWTMLLSIGFLIGFKTPFLWTSMLSIGMLIGIALVFNETLQHFFSDNPLIGIAGSLLVVLDWHLLWSAGSGMETLFYCLACIYIFWILISKSYWGWLGALCGLIVWIRPDGITMLGPVFLIIFIQIVTHRFRLKDGMRFAFPLIGLLALYCLFNYSISGSILPNTFYAKQVEYASVLMLPLVTRLSNIFLVPLSGIGIFLLPGFIFAIITGILKRNWWLLSAVLWFIGYGVIYAVRLPMTYQHGRYLFPLIPIFYLIGVIGTIYLLKRSIKIQKKLRNFMIFSGTVLGVISIIFDISGAATLINDINTIETLMVKPSIWIKENTSSNEVIAVHDIGAMGYFSDRRIIDLAGLIQPELIPIVGNELLIKNYLVQSKADYLVIIKDWYSGLEDFGKVEETFTVNTEKEPVVVEIRKINK